MKKFNRVLLKLQVRALAGERKTGFDEDTCIRVAKQVKTLVDEGISKHSNWQVISGERSSETIDRTKADQLKHAATVELHLCI